MKLRHCLEDGTLISYMTFSDDMILISSTATGLNEQVDAFSSKLAMCGLKLNPQKGVSLQTDTDGNARRWVLNPQSTIVVNGTTITGLGIDDTYKYLCLQAGPLGLRKSYGEFIRIFLDRITRVPLKPQQRVFLMRCHLLPKMYHGLVLGETLQRHFNNWTEQSGKQYEIG